MAIPPSTASAADTDTPACAYLPGEFMSVPDAALAIGRSRGYLYRRLRDGRLPGIQFGRTRMIRRDVITGFVANAVELGLSISFEEYAASWTPARRRHGNVTDIREVKA